MQQAGAHKYELRLSVGADGRDIAVASFNNHHEFFGRRFDIALAAGGPAHTGCVAFGLERWVLALLAQHPGRVLTHRTILKAIWGPHAVVHPEHLRVVLGAPRKKIEREPSRPRYILTEPWVGYRFADTET